MKGKVVRLRARGRVLEFPEEAADSKTPAGKLGALKPLVEGIRQGKVAYFVVAWCEEDGTTAVVFGGEGSEVEVRGLLKIGDDEAREAYAE